jgi:uncharacterized Zn finger protein
MRRRSRGWYGGWYPKAPPKKPPPKHGIRVRRTGTTWWGQRWIEALENMSSQYSNRLGRGHTYARAGRVHDLVIRQGKVTARVTGSRATPYTVTIQVASLGDATWSKAIAAMAQQAVFTAQLLASEMPKEIEAAFGAAGASLFPTKAEDLRTECSCPDWANPCKHVAATHYVLGEAFDNDPFLLFELRGRGKERVLEALRGARATGARETVGKKAEPEESLREAVAASVALDRSAAGDGYERLRGPLVGLHFLIESPQVHAAVLRQLGPPPAWSIDEPIVACLERVYELTANLARQMAVAGQTDRDDMAPQRRAKRSRPA